MRASDRVWLIGSPDTVAQKLRGLYGLAGGFGTLLMMTFDHLENRAACEKSMRLLAAEVMPQVADLTGEWAGMGLRDILTVPGRTANHLQG